MSKTYWWQDYGPFRPYKMCPTRPDPGEVLLFYLEKRGIGPDEQISYLIDLLDLQKSMIYNILKGEGLEAISRCRLLVQALKIYPPLLGIDAQYYPIERHAYWWEACGFSFNTDFQGYPLMSEVIAYLRGQTTQTEEGGRVKGWSQEDLGDATGLKKETIYRMEHDRNPLILEHMGRRALVASALGTLAGENEPMLFRLFGLDPQAYGVPVPAHESVPVIYLPHARPSAEMLQGYHQRQKAFFTKYLTCHAQDIVGEAREWVQLFPVLMQEAHTTAERVSLLALQSRTHRLLACIAREQCQKEQILFHTGKAVELAEQAMTLPNPKLGGDRAHVLTTKELFAAALLTAALAFYELDDYELAQEQIDRALTLLPALASSQLKRQILADAGLIHASTATSETDRTLVCSYLKHAASGLDPHEPHAPDDNYVWCGKGMLYLRKAMVFSAPHMKGVKGETVSDILEDAQRWTPPELIRRRVLIEVFQALDHFEAGSYEWATEAALSALEKSQQIRSHLNRARIEELYHQLLSTSYRDKPYLSYLGVKLRTWDHGMG